MKNTIVLFCFLALYNSVAQTTEAEDKTAILAVMKLQEKAWSENDLEGFMQGYWKNDSLKFYGRNGLTKGWQCWQA